MTDIFQEVEEDVRREKLEKIWRRHSPLILSIGALVLLATGGITAWRTYAAREQAEDARAYLAAAAKVEATPLAAVEDFGRLSKEGGGYATLSAFRQAEALQRIGKGEDARAIYEKLAANGGVDEKLRALAVLKAAYLVADKADLPDLRARLTPLTRADGAFRHAARELLAFAALKHGERDTAIKEFRALKEDATAPDSLRDRAQDMLSALGVSALGAVPAPSQEGPAGTAAEPRS